MPFGCAVFGWTDSAFVLEFLVAGAAHSSAAIQAVDFHGAQGHRGTSDLGRHSTGMRAPPSASTTLQGRQLIPSLNAKHRGIVGGVKPEKGSDRQGLNFKRTRSSL